MPDRPPDLPAFLRARLDEEQVAAEGCPPWPWRFDPDEEAVIAADGVQVADVFALSGRQHRATGDHIAAHDPARVLREVDAKRRMVDLYETVRAACDASKDNYVAWLNSDPLPHPEEAEGTSEQKSMRAGLEATLRLLALPYGQHPDYREEWKP